LTIAEPRVRVTIYENGRSNLPRPQAARARRNPIEQVLGPRSDDLRCKGHSGDRSAQIPLDLRGEPLGPLVLRQPVRYSGDVSFRQLTVNYASYLPLALDADLTLELEKDRLTIRKGRRDRAVSHLVTGVVDDLLSPRAILSLDGKFSLAEMQSVARIRPGTGNRRGRGRTIGAGGSAYRLAGKIAGSGLSAGWTTPRSVTSVWSDFS
jgi:hypothetical protein